MKKTRILVTIAGSAFAFSVQAQPEQFLPHLVYRTGPYAVNGAPFADGVADYWNMVNARDGGINGVKIVYEECETGYSTDKGLECYERLKGKGTTGAGYFSPLSTGLAFAFTAKAQSDKIPILTPGYGRSESQDGSVFKWNFPIAGTHWSAADIALQYIAQQLGGVAALKGKKIALLYNDSPYGKDPIPFLTERSKSLGFNFLPIPVTHPGVEQKSQWLMIRRERPDYVLLWGWGVMNATAIQEATSVQYPREKIIGTWWSGGEEDVLPSGSKAVGYKSVVLQPPGQFGVHADILKYVYRTGRGGSDKSEIGRVRYNLGVFNSMVGVEAIRVAQKRFGNKPLTGEQIQWGFENLELTAARLKELGFEGMISPFKISCENHAGVLRGGVQQWDGAGWKSVSSQYTADGSVAQLVKTTAKRYAEDTKVAVRDCTSSK